MSVFKILFLVGVFVYAHAGEDSVTMKGLALEQVTATGKPPSTMYIRIIPEAKRIHPILSMVVVKIGTVVGERSFQDAKLEGEFIHGLTGIGETQESKAVNFKEIVFRRTLNDTKRDTFGIFKRNIVNEGQFTEAPLAFEGISDEKIKEALEKGDLDIVAASYHLADKSNAQGGINLFHTKLSYIKPSSEINYYTATVEGPVDKSAPLYLFDDGKKELQLAGIVTEIITPEKEIKFVAGPAFIKYVRGY